MFCETRLVGQLCSVRNGLEEAHNERVVLSVLSSSQVSYNQGSTSGGQQGCQAYANFIHLSQLRPIL